ncbi:MAG: thiolase family protein [Planctomycetota bacterium]
MNSPSKNRLAVLGGVRTPQAKAFGALREFSAVHLAQHAVGAVLKRTGVAPEDIEETVIGNVGSPPDAANIARVIALTSGVPQDRIAHTVNRNCASGMESIISAWQILREGRARLILAGGTESMSQIPFIARDSFKQKLMTLSRCKTMFQKLSVLSSLRLRDIKPIPGLELGLTDPTCGLSMAQTAEFLATEFGVTREAQDDYALESHKRAVAAGQRCFLSGEIAALSTNDKEMKLDAGPREKQSVEQLAKLRPICNPKGTVTAGNSCPLTDGATALLLASESSLDSFSCKPMGFVSGYAIAGCDPKRMGLGPVFATAKLLEQQHLQLADFDLIELNEAFAAQVLACQKAFASTTFAQEFLGRSGALGEIDPQKLNVHGGAIALGHPLGATGARMVLTLLRALQDKGLKRGIATLCVGGGQGVAIMVET